MISKKIIYLLIIYALIIILNIIINKHKFNILEKNIISDLLNVKQLINFIVRILIGYYYTNYWKIIFIAECGIEIFYYIKYNNDNTIDLSWNIIGFMTGLILKYYKTTDDKNKTINKSSNDNLSNNKACIDSSSEPISDQVVESVSEPVSDQVAEPVLDQVAEPVSEPVLEPVSEPAGESIAVSEPVTELVTKPVTEAVTEPVTEAVSEPVTEAVSEPVTEAVSVPVTEAVSEPVTEVVSEPVTDTAVEQVAELVTKQTVNPAIEFFDTLTDKSIETNTNKKSENQLLNVNSDGVDLQVVDIENESKSYLKEMFENSDKKMRKMNETNKKHKKHKKSKRKNK